MLLHLDILAAEHYLMPQMLLQACNDHLAERAERTELIEWTGTSRWQLQLTTGQRVRLGIPGLLVRCQEMILLVGVWGLSVMLLSRVSVRLCWMLTDSWQLGLPDSS